MTAIVEAAGHGEVELDLAADYSTLSESDVFWQRMSDSGFLYNKYQGAEVTYEAFPERLEDLGDDPFRSVAWLTRRWARSKI